MQLIRLILIIEATQVVKRKFLIDHGYGALHFVNTPYISVCDQSNKFN